MGSDKIPRRIKTLAERKIQALRLLQDWKAYKQLDYNSPEWWEKFIQKHRSILNYTKASRLVSNSLVDKEIVKSIIDLFIRELFPEDGTAPDLDAIDFSTLHGISKLIEFATGLTYSKSPKHLKYSYGRKNWSIALLLLLLSRLTKKRGTAIKLIKGLVNQYKSTLHTKAPH